MFSPTYAPSKFLASLLSPIVGLSDSQVRNSQQFAQFITTQNVPDSEVLVSFDVVSLFTHAPTSQAIQVTCDRLINDSSLFQTEPASPWMTSAPFSNSAWRPPTWPLKAKYTGRCTARGWGHLCR